MYSEDKTHAVVKRRLGDSHNGPATARQGSQGKSSTLSVTEGGTVRRPTQTHRGNQWPGDDRRRASSKTQPPPPFVALVTDRERLCFLAVLYLIFSALTALRYGDALSLASPRCRKRKERLINKLPPTFFLSFVFFLPISSSLLVELFHVPRVSFVRKRALRTVVSRGYVNSPNLASGQD